MSTAEDATERRDRYRALLDTIRYNTGGPDRPNPQEASIRACHIRVVMVAHGSHSARDFDLAMQAARENDAVIRFPGPEGYDRFTLREEGHVRQAYREEAARADPNAEVVGWLYTVLQAVIDGE